VEGRTSGEGRAGCPSLPVRCSCMVVGGTWVGEWGDCFSLPKVLDEKLLSPKSLGNPSLSGQLFGMTVRIGFKFDGMCFSFEKGKGSLRGLTDVHAELRPRFEDKSFSSTWGMM
jgi:hypothetical protein